jgi:hypothetical protein
LFIIFPPVEGWQAKLGGVVILFTITPKKFYNSNHPINSQKRNPLPPKLLKENINPLNEHKQFTIKYGHLRNSHAMNPPTTSLMGHILS